MKKRSVLGLIEKVVITGAKKREAVLARIDTGATSSSIDLQLAATLELGPITSLKVIKSAAGIGRRPLVRTKVKLAGQVLEADFNLVDRSHMTYRVLIGQNVLKTGKFIIDPLKNMKRK